MSYTSLVNARNSYDGQLKANEASFDNTWKTIQQAAQVPAEKKNAFKEIISGYANARGENGGSILSAVREAVPNLDLGIYDKLMNIIVGARATWTTDQKTLADKAMIYNNVAQSPLNIIARSIGGFPSSIKAKIVSSDKTEEAFKTAKDNAPLELFK